MHLEIKQREREGIPILDLKGRIVLGAEDSSLRQRLESMSDAGAHNAILNLHEVSQLDSAGLGTLALIANKFRDSGGKLVLLNIAPSHAQLPEILKLNTLFESYQDEVDAVNSFFPDRRLAHYDILEFVEQMEHDHAAEPKASEEKQ